MRSDFSRLAAAAMMNHGLNRDHHQPPEPREEVVQMDNEYEKLAEAIERKEFVTDPTSVLYGEAAAEEGRRMLREATGTDDVDELTRMLANRRGDGAEDWPAVQAQVSQDLKDQLEALARHEQRSESDIVRDALTAFLHQEQEPHEH